MDIFENGQQPPGIHITGEAGEFGVILFQQPEGGEPPYPVRSGKLFFTVGIDGNGYEVVIQVADHGIISESSFFHFFAVGAPVGMEIEEDLFSLGLCHGHPFFIALPLNLFCNGPTGEEEDQKSGNGE